MATTNTERIRELELAVVEMRMTVESLRDAIRDLEDQRTESEKSMKDKQQKLELELALLKQEFQSSTKHADLWSTRGFQILLLIISAINGYVFGVKRN
ncbi:MAG: hypothetical protein ACRC8S_10395 [Fimbriiglobus sp.]